MATLTTRNVAVAGTDPAFVAASAGGDKLQPSSETFLHVKNGGGGAITVTVNSVRQCNQGFEHDLVVSVPAGAERLIGPLDDRYRDTLDSLAAVTYSGVTNVTVAAIRLKR